MLSVLIFLINTLLGVYLSIIALRIIMRAVKWDRYHPFVHVITQLTAMPIRFLQPFIPTTARWDIPALVLLCVVSLLKIQLISLLTSAPLPLLMLIRLTLLDVMSLFITLFSISIIIEVVLSWLSPQPNPIIPLIKQMNAPLLQPIKRHLPAVSGIDFSPFIALLGLQVLSILIMEYLSL